ncbi:MAG TPA: hypothetical protein VN859_00305 [Steroidobacteraceae bacterium]|nr:hypothetical protein [Steroidobacteraceae bacterium]
MGDLDGKSFGNICHFVDLRRQVDIDHRRRRGVRAQHYTGDQSNEASDTPAGTALQVGLSGWGGFS